MFRKLALHAAVTAMQLATPKTSAATMPITIYLFAGINCDIVCHIMAAVFTAAPAGSACNKAELPTSKKRNDLLYYICCIYHT